LPRKEYKTITIKAATFQRFVEAATKAKKDNPNLDYSKFIDMLLKAKK
jgi:hypothetical protein